MSPRAAASLQPWAMRAQHSCISRSTPIAAISLCQTVIQSRIAASGPEEAPERASAGGVCGSEDGFLLLMRLVSLRPFWHRWARVVM